MLIKFINVVIYIVLLLLVIQFDKITVIATENVVTCDEVNFSGFTAEETLLELWSATKALGLGRLHSHHQPNLQEAKEQLTINRQYVDYFFGKPIKTDFSSFPILKARSYDNDAGECTMLQVSQRNAKHIGKTQQLSQTEVDHLLDNNLITIETISNEKVILLNGFETTQSDINRVNQKIDKLYAMGMEGLTMVSDLVKIARRDSRYKPFADNELKLRDMGLLNKNGRIGKTTRAIVINSFTGDSFELKRHNPVRM